MSGILKTAEAIVREAGALLLAGYGRAHQIEHKGAIDLVTEFDHRSEALIVSRLGDAFPDHAIRAEEGGPAGGASEYEWLVDPLDGTTNFAHGFPVFAVSLALTQRGQLAVGVVYDPLRDELYAAQAGRGATLNGRPIRVSTQATLDGALLGTGFPYDVRTNPHNNFAQFIRFQLRAQAVRRAGSAALDCCWVAAGRLEGYWEFRMKPWDIGAGALIVRAAGGCVTTATGAEDFLGRDSIVVSNGLVHAQMLEVLREGGEAPLPSQKASETGMMQQPQGNR
jgi:myo-inositol-1(or 4)-monophosphatase